MRALSHRVRVEGTPHVPSPTFREHYTFSVTQVQAGSSSCVISFNFISSLKNSWYFLLFHVCPPWTIRLQTSACLERPIVFCRDRHRLASARIGEADKSFNSRQFPFPSGFAPKVALDPVFLQQCRIGYSLSWEIRGSFLLMIKWNSLPSHVLFIHSPSGLWIQRPVNLLVCQDSVPFCRHYEKLRAGENVRWHSLASLCAFSTVCRSKREVWTTD